MKKKISNSQKKLNELKEQNRILNEEKELKKYQTKAIFIALECFSTLFLSLSILLNWANYEMLGRIKFELIIPLFLLSCLFRVINIIIPIITENNE